MSRDKILRIERQRLSKAFHELAEKSENNTRLIDKTTRILYR